MRPLIEMDTIVIDITNACPNRCSNCTRFCGHRPPYFFTFDQFKAAIDSMAGFPNMVGFCGGEPLMHRGFQDFCLYAQTRFPKEQLGLWTCFPKGFEHHREVICDTFGHLFLNDHTRLDVLHAPILVAAEEVIPDRQQMFLATERCWLQECWSACISPKGAFFCEVAAHLAVLFDGPAGWPVESGWWLRLPKHYREQREEWCPKCGVALPLPRRPDFDGRDDISPGNLERLRTISGKIIAGHYVVSNLKLMRGGGGYPKQTYKDMEYRHRIANRYGIYLLLNPQGSLTPKLK
jgi:hypothetical protein